MQIGCLGWGSLIWNSGELPIRGKWFEDGPFLPIEFARKSNNGRITLVLVDDKPLVRSLWILLNCETIDAAEKALASRERILENNIVSDIGFWQKNNGSNGKCIDIISRWAEGIGLDAVVWTNLRPKFNSDDHVPTVDQIIEYISNLPIEQRRIAEEYIKKAPPQIDTEYRRKILMKLNWLHE